MRRSVRVYPMLMMALLVLAAGQPVLAAKPITLTYANFPPAPTFPCVQMEHWKQEVEQRTEGRLVIQTFPGGTLLGAKNMFDGVVMGQADIGCLAMSYHPGRFPLAEAVDLPHGWPNAEVASLTLMDLFAKYHPESFAKVKVLTLFTCPPANIMSIAPVRALADLKGLEIRAAGTGVRIFELLGASPIGMPQSDVPDALHKKVIKGMASSLEVMQDFNYAEYCRYITMTNLQVVSFAVVMNRKRWEALPDDIKAILDQLGREQAQWTGRYVDAHVDQAVAWSKATYQVEVLTLPPEDQAQMHALLKPLIDDYIARTRSQVPSEDIIRDIQALKDTYSAVPAAPAP